MKWKYAYKELFRGKAENRILLYAALKELFEDTPFLCKEARVLELGNRPASHQRSYPSAWKVETSDVVAHDHTDHVIDANKPFPFEDGAFDGVVFFNVLPIVKDVEMCMTESFRVASKFVLFNSALISGIADDPIDYNRFTEARLRDMLDRHKRENKFTQYHIYPLGGRFTSALTTLSPYLRFKIIRIPANIVALLMDNLDRYTTRKCPQQYFVYIEK